ncbi:MAG: helix-turn-helix transcriptional regulator [Planctomyces sp.]|nr:helix-turn-helix transcriptional regulator [Planctomyces sp.]
MENDSVPFDSRMLAARVRMERMRLGMDAGELATRAGLGRTTLYHLEKGHTRRVSPSTIKALADALSISVDELLSAPAAQRTPALASPPPAPRRPLSDASRFDRATNPAVADVVRERPVVFTNWSDDDWDELYSQFGVGGQLTPLGVLSAAEAINQKRDVIRQLHIVLDTHLKDVAREFIGTLYRMVQATTGELPEPPTLPDNPAPDV